MVLGDVEGWLLCNSLGVDEGDTLGPDDGSRLGKVDGVNDGIFEGKYVGL